MIKKEEPKEKAKPKPKAKPKKKAFSSDEDDDFIDDRKAKKASSDEDTPPKKKPKATKKLKNFQGKLLCLIFDLLTFKKKYFSGCKKGDTTESNEKTRQTQSAENKQTSDLMGFDI